MVQGKIIEYIDQGKFVCTLCLQDKGNRLHLLTSLNREVSLSRKRAFLVSNAAINTLIAREDLIKQLKHKESVRARLQETIKVKELWELVRDEHESFDYKYLSQLCFGEEVTDDHISALARALFEDKFYFKMKDSRFFANSEERVAQILNEREERARREDILQKGSAWLSQVIKGIPQSPPDCEEDINRLLSELALYGRDASEYRDGRELLTRAGIADIDTVGDILIKLGVWEEDENLDLLRFDIQADFSEKVMKEGDKLVQPTKTEIARKDLRHLHVLTVDGALTRDFDDALSLNIEDGVFNLGIHIADVAGAVPPEGILDREAARRGTSLYLPRHQIPMIPPSLSQDILSLVLDRDRPAISLLARLDKNGELLDLSFTPSLIRVRHQLTYDQVNESCRNDETLGKMIELSRIMQQKRKDQGALILSFPEISINIDKDSNISFEMTEQDTPSRTMVAEFMIFYNWMASRFCRDNNIPILYRGQEKPDELLQADPSNYFFYVFKQRRKLKPLMVETEPKPHRGLGLDAYTNVSSPIRRYLDLIVQRQIRNFLMNRPLPYDAEQLEQIRMTVEPLIKARGMVKRNRMRYWIQKYLTGHRNEAFPALVLYSMKRRYRILLTDFLQVADLKRETDRKFNEGEKIMVRVKKSNPRKDELLLEFAGDRQR